jgi:spoIIIJ-associated protein
VEEALAAASRELGLPLPALRYVVLQRGSRARLGLGATPARIAVLLDDDDPPAGGRLGGGPDAESPGGSDTEAEIRRVVEAILAGGELDLKMEVESAADAIVVRLAGPDRGFFYGEEGEVLRAVEHLLQRIAARGGGPRRRVLVECEGYRERRDQALRAEARALAAAVKASGEPRTTRPLNSYERRIVHLALAGEETISTFSVGEGEDRRVTIAPRTAPPPGGARA